MLIEQERFADVLNFWKCAFYVEGFGENDFENLIKTGQQGFYGGDKEY